MVIILQSIMIMIMIIHKKDALQSLAEYEQQSPHLTMPVYGNKTNLLIINHGLIVTCFLLYIRSV